MRWNARGPPVLPCYNLQAGTRYMFLRLSSDSHLQWTIPVVVSPVRSVIWNGRGCLWRMHSPSSCERHCSSHIVSKISSKPLPDVMALIEPMNESKKWNPTSRMTTPERGLYVAIQPGSFVLPLRRVVGRRWQWCKTIHIYYVVVPHTEYMCTIIICRQYVVRFHIYEC